ncbi:M23 family metallopeptidase [Kocuria sp. cx-455]|uniref:M23 family metallopeptidase n=2 Tax=unclassified Candidatus Sulfotelmatobacter TaxID=2635724 RepID=UPI001CC26B75|nr:M23 family metallopeptidase [Kocuria sp. cx-455]
MMSDDAALAPSPRASRAPLGFRARALTLVLALCVFLGGVVGGGVAGPPPARAAGGWTWPVKPQPAVTRSFQPPAQKWLSGHRGVDLGAAPGTEVRSPAAGTVSFTGVVVDRPVITVDHGAGLKSSFEPVAATVERGQSVARGQVIGTIAEAGHCPPANCVHWGVRRDGDYVNPLQFVQDMRPSVLLPVPR